MAQTQSQTPCQILICDDDAAIHSVVKQTLKKSFAFRSAYNSEEARAILKNHSVDIVMLDVEMRNKDEGLKAIPVLLAIDSGISIVMASGRTDFDTVREAMRLGAIDYISKDFSPEELILVISRVVERRKLLKRNEQQKFELNQNQRQNVLIGKSKSIESLRKQIDRVKQSLANVIITGETGTGKEVVARLLRQELPDGTQAPFIAVDSATIQSTTAESQLFGHEKGAFTGAEKTTKGIFEEANGGIVYFDEIANMPLDIQSKLLRVIQEKEIVRLGSSRPISSDFRVICATNRKLDEMVKLGQFKEDLYQRLEVLPIHIPPLRERAEDIPLLVEHFIKKQPRVNLHFTQDALSFLQSYPWPGNIRELGNLIAYVATMAETDEVDIADLPPKMRDFQRTAGNSGSKLTGGDRASFYERVGAYEKEILDAEYTECAGNISKMALQLGMDRSHLYTKLKEFNIHTSKR